VDQGGGAGKSAPPLKESPVSAKKGEGGKGDPSRHPRRVLRPTDWPTRHPAGAREGKGETKNEGSCTPQGDSPVTCVPLAARGGKRKKDGGHCRRGDWPRTALRLTPEKKKRGRGGKECRRPPFSSMDLFAINPEEGGGRETSVREKKKRRERVQSNLPNQESSFYIIVPYLDKIFEGGGMGFSIFFIFLTSSSWEKKEGGKRPEVRSFSIRLI